MKEIINNLKQNRVKEIVKQWFDKITTNKFSVIRFGPYSSLGIFVMNAVDYNEKRFEEKRDLTQQQVLSYLKEYFNIGFPSYEIEVFDNLAIIVRGDKQYANHLTRRFYEMEQQKIIQEMKEQIEQEIKNIPDYSSYQKNIVKKKNRVKKQWDNLEEIFNQCGRSISKTAKYFNSYYSVIKNALKRKNII